MKKDFKPRNTKGINAIASEKPNAINKGRLAGLSRMFVPYRRKEAIMRMTHSEMSIPTIIPERYSMIFTHINPMMDIR